MIISYFLDKHRRGFLYSTAGHLSLSGQNVNSYNINIREIY